MKTRIIQKPSHYFPTHNNMTHQLSATPFAFLLLGGGRRWVSYNYYPPISFQLLVMDSPQQRHEQDFETFMG